MKIAHVLWNGSIGGAERFAHDLVIEQRAMGHDAQIWIANENGWFGKSAERQGVSVRLFGLRSGRDLINLMRMTRALREEAFDIIHVHTGTPLFDAWALTLRPAKYVRHFHGVHNPKGLLDRYFDQLWNACFEPLMNLNIFNSIDTLQRVQKERKLKLHNSHIVPCGISIDQYQCTPKKRQDLRTELDIPADIFVVAGLGRLCPQKGFEDFIRMAEQIQLAVSDTYFLLVGDGVSRNNLDRMVEEAGLCRRFKFAGFRHDIPDVLSAFDCMVITSKWEPFGIVCLEAMAADCPVVAYDIDGIHEAGGDAPLYAKSGDVDQLVAHVLELKNDSFIREEHIEKGRGQVHQFDIRDIALLVDELYVNKAN